MDVERLDMEGMEERSGGGAEERRRKFWFDD